MSEHESSSGDRVQEGAGSSSGDRMQEVADGFTPAQQAGLTTAAAFVTGSLLAVFGLALDVGSGAVMVLIGFLGLLVVTGVVYAFFRAMLVAADEHDGDPMAAVTYPLFPALFSLLAVVVAAFIAVFIGQVG